MMNYIMPSEDEPFTYTEEVNRKTQNKRDVMRTIVEHHGSYTDEEGLEDDFDACKDRYEYVSSNKELDLNHCICGHEIHELCKVVYNDPELDNRVLELSRTMTVVKGKKVGAVSYKIFCDLHLSPDDLKDTNEWATIKSDITNNTFIIGNDCIRLFGGVTANLANWVASYNKKTVVKVPKWFSGKYPNPFVCVKYLRREYIADFTFVGGYSRLGLVLNPETKLYHVVAQVGAKSYRILGGEKFPAKKVVWLDKVTKPFYMYPMDNEAMWILNNILADTGFPRQNQLLMKSGKYKDSFFNYLWSTDRGWCRWYLQHRPTEDIQQFAEEVA